ncbi:fumarylacetoacetate hydrolase family protein [Permianibacter sp. IMCC34836]|uniref:fumarylacetoacetate hydrolase family protein n=1 Tax=Permianibacter fluminis TaxID=2738515 RepID=UPI0015568C50|nr:fumarylacetoacetate hydrolase family protein [Permianibacter fluminis]NQD38808.1 fumarylacetoacetate hydrolase family protein [Permianibacter fluminis]
MKFATLKNGSRDGQLVLVSRDLQHCAAIPDIAPTLQALLDQWAVLAPKAQALYAQLNAGTLAAKAFDEAVCLSPLPRAYQWADGSAYVNHVELVRKARGAEMPPSFWTDPLMYQGGSDTFLAPRDPIVMASEDFGIDMESEVAVITGDVPMAASAELAAKSIRLLMLVNDVSLRNLIPAELAKGFGFFQSKPSSAFSPVAVTPDELGTAWQDGKVQLPLLTWRNQELMGKPNAGVDMTFNFPALVAHAAKTRPLGAGAIIGSGTVSNRDTDGGAGKPVVDGGLGYSCIAEVRTVETLRHGAAKTSFLKYGERVRIEMLDASGHSIFGAIDQTVQPYTLPG